MCVCERERENYAARIFPCACARARVIPSVRVNLTVQTVLEIFNFEIDETSEAKNDLWAEIAQKVAENADSSV